MLSVIRSELLPQSSSPFEQIPPHEREVLELALEGRPNKAIGKLLRISLRSVERRRAAALRRQGVQTLVEATKLKEMTGPPSEAIIVATFRSCADGLAVVTRDDRFAAVNGADCQIMGYTEAELLGQGFAAVTYPDDLTANVRNAERLFSGTATEFRMQKRYVRRGGDIVPAELSGTVARPPNGPPQFVLGRITVATFSPSQSVRNQSADSHSADTRHRAE